MCNAFVGVWVNRGRCVLRIYPSLLLKCMVGRYMCLVYFDTKELNILLQVFRPDKLNGFEVQSEADAMLERQRRDIMPGLTTPRTPYEKP